MGGVNDWRNKPVEKGWAAMCRNRSAFLYIRSAEDEIEVLRRLI